MTKNAQKSDPGNDKAARNARLKEALRDNLKKRKAQARARTDKGEDERQDDGFHSGEGRDRA